MATQTKKTKRIAGHSITLLDGVRYIATRPMGPPPGKPITVTIKPMVGAPPEAEEFQIAGLTYDEAKRLLGAFNNGPMSFDGRVW